MAKATTYNTSANKEDIMSTITILEPEACPLISMAKKGKASATFFEWQADSLLSPDFSGIEEGEDVQSFTNQTANRARLGIPTKFQIFKNLF